MCFKVREEGYKDGSEMVAKGVSITLANIACTINILSLLVALWQNLLHFHPIQP